MKYDSHMPRVFKIGSVYFAAKRNYDPEQDDKFYLVLGPSKKPAPNAYFVSGPAPNAYFVSGGPVEYEYLDLFTGKTGDFHRDSYFAERAELFG